MTGQERTSLDQINARLFGLDGSGIGENGGAIGNVIARIERLEKRMNYWAGGIAVVVFVAELLRPYIATALGLPK